MSPMCRITARPRPALQCRGLDLLDAFRISLGVVDETRTGDEPADFLLSEDVKKAKRNESVLAPSAPPPAAEYATFAGGCFWGLELAFQRVPGVLDTAVGYTQGEQAQPNYVQVCKGTTGHTEAVLVTYSPEEVSYEQLLQVWAGRTDLTTRNRQGNDRGPQYRSGVYTHTEAQAAAATQFLAEMQREVSEGRRRWEGGDVVAEAAPAREFWIAEEMHQRYLERGGRSGRPQSAEKGCTDTIRCYG